MDEVRNKLFPGSIGTVKELPATPEVVTIDEDGITNTVSLDRVALDPNGHIHFTDSITIQQSSPDDATSQVETSPPAQAEGYHEGQNKK